RHYETDPFDSGEALLVHAQAAQPFAARALEVAQVVGIVDNPSDVHVFVVDAQLPGKRLRRVGRSLHRPIVACAMLVGMEVLAHLLAPGCRPATRCTARAPAVRLLETGLAF